MMRPHRQHPGYWAFLAHRLSGLGLALFLPLHFITMGLALRRNALDGFLAWTENPPVKLVETVLVMLLALHATGGLRLLALEFLPWHDRQKTYLSIGFGVALLTGLLFLLNATRCQLQT